MKAIRAVIAACIFVLGVSIPQTYTNSAALHAQDLTPTTHDHLVVQGCVNIPPGQKRPDFGCFSLATESGLRFSEPTAYWHLRTFPNRAAADAAKSPTGIVVEEDGRVWLSEFGSHDLALQGGQAVAIVGPMELPKAESYAVVLAYAVMRPNDRSIVHVHPGTGGLVHDLGRSMSGNSSRRDQSDCLRHGDSTAECSNGTDHHRHRCAKISGLGDP